MCMFRSHSAANCGYEKKQFSNLRRDQNHWQKRDIQAKREHFGHDHVRDRRVIPAKQHDKGNFCQELQFSPQLDYWKELVFSVTFEHKNDVIINI